MKSMTLRITALLLACLCLCAQAFAEEEDPAVIRVGDVSYPLSMVQFALDPYFDLADAQEETLTLEDRKEIADQVVERLVGVAVIENKLAETGHNTFTDSETEILNAEARRQYEETWQQMFKAAQEYAPDVTETEVTDWLDQKGYTVQAFLRELMTRERESRILDLYCADVTVTDEEVRAYFCEMYLDPDRERYADNIPLFEEEILGTESQSFYTPEGYRTLRNIQLDYPEEIQSALNALYLEGRKAVSEAQTAYSDLAAAAAAGEDTTKPKETYDAKMAAMRELEAKYLAKEEEAIPLLQDKLDAIRAEKEAGVGIDTLIAKYSTAQSDSASLYHPKSEQWSESARKAIDAMQSPGELSAPFADESGVHLAYYESDVEGGERLLTTEENELLRSSALLNAKRMKLQTLAEEWRKDYEIFTDASLLKLE